MLTEMLDVVLDRGRSFDGRFRRAATAIADLCRHLVGPSYRSRPTQTEPRSVMSRRGLQL
jgi:hypothetical protein